jgi:PAS domain S-box-containing protein
MERLRVITARAHPGMHDAPPEGALLPSPHSIMRRDPLELAHLAKIVDSSDDAIVSKDLDGTIRSWNRAAERMFGYTAEEAVGRSIRMIIPADLQAEEDSVLARIRSGLTVDHFETRRQRKDGTELLISLTVSPLFDDHGRVVGASKIARDVTEAWRLRNLVREQGAVAQTLSEIGAAIAASLDGHAIIQRVTDAAIALTSAEVGVFVSNLMEPTARSAFMTYTRTGMSGGVFETLPAAKAADSLGVLLLEDEPLRLADFVDGGRFGGSPLIGGILMRSMMLVPIKNGSGEKLGALCLGHAQPSRFSAQHEMVSIGLGAWASLALENSRLYAEAREAGRLRDEFLAVLSHELRTPLNAIVGYATLLRGGMLDGQRASHALETIDRNSRALAQIVDDVLDVSRILAGKLRLDVQPVELQLIVHNAIATVQPAADAKGVRLDAAIDPNVGPVSGDPNRLQQVVWNLLSNAVKFTPRGGHAEVRAERHGTTTYLEVRDSGIGINPEFLPHVFERFRQADAGTTRKTGGLGLGLSIVRHIIEAHGGSVDVSSAGEGHGATFRVGLPAALPHGPVVTDLPSEARPGRLAALARVANLQGVRVLVIEDDPDALALVQLVLESAGAHVTAMSSAKRALEGIERIRPDAMVVDLAMPEMDGYELIARVRRSAQREICDIPAAALTAFARSEDRTRALESGFEMHLAKPIDPEELVASVATLVRRSRARSA